MVGSKLAGVAPPVMSSRSSSSVSPTASFAATLAIGKPVAFEASADDRETRVHLDDDHPPVSIDYELDMEPPVSTPISRGTAIDADRIR